MLKSTLKSELHVFTSKFITSTTLFRENKINLNWLIDGSVFWPSYQTLHFAGSNLATTYLNYFFGKHTFFKKRAIDSICMHLNQGYFYPLKEKNISIDQSALDLFFKLISSLLSTHWSIIHSWSYTELFSYLTHCSSIFLSHINLKQDFYSSDKEEQNTFGLQSYNELRDLVINKTLPFHHVLYLVIRANWIDNYRYNPSRFLLSFSEEINDVLDQKDWVSELINHNKLFYWETLHNDLVGPQQVFLYECDNAGEVFFDLLLIELLLIHGHNVIMSLKSNPILNDITFSDFELLLSSPSFIHLKPYLKSGQLRYISNNIQDVVCLRYLCSDVYKKAYQEASILILKGQGHFESYPLYKINIRQKTPIRYQKKHFYLFGIKSSHTLKSVQSIYNHASMGQIILLNSR